MYNHHICIYNCYILDKTIKLWKVFDKSLKLVTENSIAPNPSPVNTLRLPTLTHHDTIVAAVPRKVYANGKERKYIYIYIIIMYIAT